MSEKTPDKRYKLKEVRIRLAEGHPLYSDVPLSSPASALEVMRKEMAKYDREVICVVNLNNRLKPINFNIVSMGSINASVAAIPNILKSGILSNASGFILLHNHPSGDATPSREDIETTKRCIEAGKLMDIPCLDHVIVGGMTGEYFSFREMNTVDFSVKGTPLTAEQTFREYEGIRKAYGIEAGKGADIMAEEMKMNNVKVPDFVLEAEEMMAKEGELPKRDEITIKFGKGLAEPFTSKDGREFMRIRIPNENPEDKSSWASFVLPKKAVHENQYGKGLWAKIPADGSTILTKPYLKGQDENGKNIWEDVKAPVSNGKLKAMVESYKTRSPKETEEQPKESTLEQLKSVAKVSEEKPSQEKKQKTKPKSREAVL